MRASALLLLLVAACKSAPEEKPPPSPAPPPSPSSPQLDEAAWRAEAERVLFERHMTTARLYRDALDIDKALEQVDQALLLEPTSERALALRAELQRLAGIRAGEVRTLVDDEWLAMQAREEERQVAARRAFDEAREAEAAGDFKRAATAYKRAIFLSEAKG